MKARAPPPPQAPQPAPRHVFRNTVPDGGGTSGMDAKENILRPTVDLQLTLPDGYQTSVTEDGSKALMDLLVDLCSRYHLNPALHTLELLSPEGHTLGFKPNALLGSLNVACVIIKEKVWEEKVVRRPAPKVPEKTVRLMVNYHGSQKAVVRVNPLVPLQSLIPVICEKCEFDPAHVLLLKDSISRHELPLNKSLTELGIKELYVHDQSLVLQPKMASAPALNHSDSIHSSTTSLGRSEKKGFLGIFQFNRRKTKTEKTSMDMDDCDDKVIQHTDRKSNGLSTVSGFTSIEDRPSTLGQSQSVMNIQAKMSPKAETKKRRAPALPGAPTPSMVHTGLEGYQTSLGSESQQRKRKAPAPPPTPASITPGPDDTSTSAIPTPDSHTAETSSPSLHTKVVQSTTTSVTTVVMQTVKPVPSKKAAQPLPVSAATPTPSSPTPSSSTTDSLAVQDSSSELSHSLDDSDADPDQTGSQCSSLSSSTASGSVLVQTIKKSSSSRVEKSEKASSNTAAKSKHKESSDSSSNSETESALNLRLDEVENNRHSAMGTADQSVPPKPHRLPGPITPSSPSTDTTESNSLHSFMEEKEAASQSWLHSMRNSTANGPKPETGTPEEETMSLASSSSSSSHDQGYAASEGMIEGEDSGMVGSPSDTQPTSPDESLSADGSSRGGEGGLLGPVQDASSDSDEGCATWGSKYRHNDSSQQTKSGRLRNSYEDDTELSAQIDQTLADFEANLAEHTEKVSKKETSYAMSTRSNEVPVSVVDMDVPVTAIDEVLEDYERNIVETKAKSLTRSVSSGSTGPDFCNQSIIEPQNKNNNACTAADSNKISSANTKQTSQPQKHRKSLEIKSKVDKKKEMRLETKVKEMSISGTNSMKKDKQRTSAVKPTIDIQKHSKSTEIKSDHVKNAAQSFQEKELVLSPTSQRMVSTESHEEMHRVHQNNSSSNTLHGKITHNVTSRFGMRTFTVVPPKPTVVDTASMPAVTLTPGAIKIDDQGNMVKVGISHNKADDSSGLGINHAEGSPLVGQVKAFWSSNERQESAVTHNKGLIDKAKESTVSLKSTTTAISQSTFKGNTEDLKTPQSFFIKLAEEAQSKEKVKEAIEPVKDFKGSNEEWVDVESKSSVTRHIQQPSNKPTLPPYVLPEPRKDLSFLKPPRRTSSHYVASAISKYAPKISAKPSSSPNIPDSSFSLKSQIFQRSGQSVLVNPQQSSQSSLSDNKENGSALKSNLSGPMRSMSYPEYVSVSQRNFGEVRVDREDFGGYIGSIKGNSNTLETEAAKNRNIHSSSPTQKSLTANNERENIKHTRLRSPSPEQSSPLHSSAKPLTAPKPIFHGQTSNTKTMPKAATYLTSDAKPQPSVTETDSGVMPGPSQVTVFGPIKKFRPVILRSVEKETSLHSSLMDAIQTGGGRDRLKKITSSESNSLKKASYVEEENERSALLAAIRAQSTAARLRKTRSKAAYELEKSRKASEEERSADIPSSSSSSSSSSPSSPSSPSPPSLTLTSPPVFTPMPPPPPAPMIAPPPPPPVLPQGKPSNVAFPSTSEPMNPAMAREAMLEAIRSGAAAGRLRKVTVPIKTVKVNGRLGTIQATLP